MCLLAQSQQGICAFFILNKSFSFALFTSWRLLINSIVKRKEAKCTELFKYSRLILIYSM